jgi:hypothetical protein
MQKPKRTAKKEFTAEESMEALIAKANDPKYSNQKYDKDSMVSIPGTLFADVVNYSSTQHQILVQLKRNLEAAVKAIDISLANQDILTLSLMKQHINNVENGSTTPVTTEEREAAMEEAKPTK